MNFPLPSTSAAGACSSGFHLSSAFPPLEKKSESKGKGKGKVSVPVPPQEKQNVLEYSFGGEATAEEVNQLGISEGSLVCIKALNETLWAPYRLSYDPPIPRKSLMFWTEPEFAVVREFVRQFPAAYPYVVKLRFAESLDPAYTEERHALLESDYRNSSLFKPQPPPAPNSDVEKREANDDRLSSGSVGDLFSYTPESKFNPDFQISQPVMLPTAATGLPLPQFTPRPSQQLQSQFPSGYSSGIPQKRPYSKAPGDKSHLQPQPHARFPSSSKFFN